MTQNDFENKIRDEQAAIAASTTRVTETAGAAFQTMMALHTSMLHLLWTRFIEDASFRKDMLDFYQKTIGGQNAASSASKNDEGTKKE